MNRDFAILGLKEDATKEDVKKAYDKWVKKYKSSDYSDDPEYVFQKMSQLKEAYNNAYAIASGQVIEPKTTKTTTRHTDTHRAATTSGNSTTENLRNRFDKIKKEIKDNIGEKTTETREKVPETSQMAETSQVAETVTEEEPVKSTMSSETGKAISAVISLVLVLITGMFTMCDNNNDDIYYEDEYVYEYNNSEDDEIHTVAQAVYDEINLMETADSYSWYELEDEEIDKEANKFAKNYSSDENLQNWSKRLFENYGNFSANSLSTDNESILAILEFYGFPSVEDMGGKDNPYTGNRIDSMEKYLEYLNDYYENNNYEDND